MLDLRELTASELDDSEYLISRPEEVGEAANGEAVDVVLDDAAAGVAVEVVIDGIGSNCVEEMDENPLPAKWRSGQASSEVSRLARDIESNLKIYRDLINIICMGQTVGEIEPPQTI